MRVTTYSSARRRAQRVLLAIGAGLTLAIAAAPAQATPAALQDDSSGICVANANGILNSDGAAAVASATTCPTGKDNGNGKGGPAGGDTGHKVG
jgi:hypothetical protein